MILDDFRSTKSLAFLRAWSTAIVGRIGTTGATYAQIEAHCSSLLAAGHLPTPKGKLCSEVRQTLARLSVIGRISSDRSVDVWRLGTGNRATHVTVAPTSCNAL